MEIPSFQPCVAVVGSGYWGRNLIRNYSELGALAAICDTNKVVLSEFKDQYPGVEICTAFSDLLARDDITGLALATPAETHYALARAALLAGKHVYVEKPLVLKESEGEDLIEISMEKELVLMVGHLLQYHPAFVKLKDLVRDGELGRINYIYSNRLNLGKIRREENILWSFAPHDISMILSLADEKPEEISACAGYFLHKKVADVTISHMEFPSGLQAHIFVSWLHPFKEQKLVVVGDSRMAVFDDTQPWEDKLLIYPHRVTWQDNHPIPVKAEPERPRIPEREPLKQECLHFLDCMLNNHCPITDGYEGLEVLKVLKRAQECLDNGKLIASRHAAAEMYATAGLPGFDTGGIPETGLVHQTAVVDEGSEIGPGTKIWHFSHVLPGSVIGAGCNIGQNVVIGPDVTIGDNCKIQNNVSIYKGVTLEDSVFCGPSMVFTNIYNPRAEIPRMDQVRPTLVKHGATLGANATIICGTTIGRYAFVGAGSVVTRNVADHALMAGNPARRIGWMCRCGERLNERLDCLACGNKYERHADGLKPRTGGDRAGMSHRHSKPPAPQ
jgi:UDP-2-acetamido-3-amino-2,3-dideoxy-glucuronate N-acetyltransferase